MARRSPLATMIALVSMPFGSVSLPSLALGQFKAQLSAAGIEARVFNLNLHFAALSDSGLGSLISHRHGRFPHLGEWLFAAEAWQGLSSLPGFNRIVENDLILWDEMIRTAAPGSAIGVKELVRMRTSVVPDFLDHWARTIAGLPGLRWAAFSCSSYQVNPSIALARRIKELNPGISTAFGGPAFHGPMGRAFFDAIPWADAVCPGEADMEVVSLFKDSGAGRACISVDPAGVGEAALSGLPVPDYGDFFKDARTSGLMSRPGFLESVQLPFETSRGCWKGQIRQCLFCGFNSRSMAQRRKKPEAVLRGLRELAVSYPVRSVLLSDNIIPNSHFRDLIPALAENPLPRGTTLYAEVHPTLGRRRVRALAAIGVTRVQAGVETLSTPLLKAMSKGVGALKNVHFLKLCLEYGIKPDWNMLTRIPGEKEGDYRSMARLIPRILHLPPPMSEPRPLELQPYSPYFEQPGRWVEQIRPREWYGLLYPEDLIDLSKVAFLFDGVWKDCCDPSAYRETEHLVRLWISLWKGGSKPPAMKFREHPDGRITVRDARQAMREGRWELDALEGRIFRTLDDPVGMGAVLRALEDQGMAVDGETLEGIIRKMTGAGLVIGEGDLFMNLGVPGA